MAKCCLSSPLSLFLADTSRRFPCGRTKRATSLLALGLGVGEIFCSTFAQQWFSVSRVVGLMRASSFQVNRLVTHSFRILFLLCCGRWACQLVQHSSCRRSFWCASF